MEKLPKVFVSPINKKINNTQDLFRSDAHKVNPVNNSKDIDKKINAIFASNNHIFKSKVLITLKDQEITADIVGKTNSNILTLDGKLIKIADIIDINKI